MTFTLSSSSDIGSSNSASSGASSLSSHVSGFDAPVPRWSTKTRSRSRLICRNGPRIASVSSLAACPGPPARMKSGSGRASPESAGRTTTRSPIRRPDAASRSSYTSSSAHNPSSMLSAGGHGINARRRAVPAPPVSLHAEPAIVDDATEQCRGHPNNGVRAPGGGQTCHVRIIRKYRQQAVGPCRAGSPRCSRRPTYSGQGLRRLRQPPTNRIISPPLDGCSFESRA